MYQQLETHLEPLSLSSSLVVTRIEPLTSCVTTCWLVVNGGGHWWKVKEPPTSQHDSLMAVVGVNVIGKGQKTQRVVMTCWWWWLLS